MDNKISVIIPNYNGQQTISTCLDALNRSRYDNFEVIVVDDASNDGSSELIEKYPCKLIRISDHTGAARARNIGAKNSSGRILFFIDADCVVLPDTLSRVNSAYNENGRSSVLGGTYTSLPRDKGFFSIFQSIFINYSETKKISSPDYIAAHAMIIDRVSFEKSGGFSEDFLPIIEDVEFSHRLKRNGFSLRMVPGLMVQHIFNFSLIASLKNAYRKTKYWTLYSLRSGDILSDSGTASTELKVNVLSHLLVIISLVASILERDPFYLFGIVLLLIINLYANRKFLRALYDVKGALFALLSAAYYLFIYPFPVGIGAVAGNVMHLRR
jgi:glycosyltransferase involved in cell wall biosynthesis